GTSTKHCFLRKGREGRKKSSGRAFLRRGREHLGFCERSETKYLVIRDRVPPSAPQTNELDAHASDDFVCCREGTRKRMRAPSQQAGSHEQGRPASPARRG